MIEGLHIRPATPEDAEGWLTLMTRIDGETRFMLYEAGERPQDTAPVRTRLTREHEQGAGVTLLAEVDGRLVGTLGLQRGTLQRNRHTAHLFIGLLYAYCGRGLGTRLLAEAETWARVNGLQRLELTVMTHNVAALGLYHKMGFQTEGTLRRSLLIDGVFVDEHLMGKLL